MIFAGLLVLVVYWLCCLTIFIQQSKLIGQDNPRTLKFEGDLLRFQNETEISCLMIQKNMKLL